MIITRQVPAINLIYSRSKKSGIWPCQIWQYHRFAPYILACQTRTKATTLCCADFLIAPDRTSVSDTPRITGSSCRKVWCADHIPTLGSTGTAHRPAPQTSWIPLCSWIYSPQLSQVRTIRTDKHIAVGCRILTWALGDVLPIGKLFMASRQVKVEKSMWVTTPSSRLNL